MHGLSLETGAGDVTIGQHVDACNTDLDAGWQGQVAMHVTALPTAQAPSGCQMADAPGSPQVDEPALREGLPLKSERWQSYLTWAVDAFKLATTVAQPSTQIVTHLCYSEFADILEVREDTDLPQLLGACLLIMRFT